MLTAKMINLEDIKGIVKLADMRGFLKEKYATKTLQPH